MKDLLLIRAARLIRILTVGVIVFIMVNIPKFTNAAGEYPLEVTIQTQATATVNGSLLLTWTNYASSYSGSYKVERKVDSGDFALAATISTPYSSNTWGTKLYWSDSVALGHSYTYRVYYYDNNTAIASNHTEQVTASITTIDTLKSFTALATTPQSVSMSWAFNGTNEYGVSIQRKSGANGTWAELASVPAGITSFIDNTAYPNSKYFYRLRVEYNPHVYSNNFPDDTGISPALLLDAPGEPVGYAVSPTQIYFSWSGVSDAVTYVIERKEYDESSFSIIGTVPADKSDYIDNQLSPDARYTYRVKAISGVGASGYSPEAVIACIYLEIPTNLTIEAVSEKKIELSWKDNSTKETGYEIWKKTGKNGSWGKYAYLNEDEGKFIDEDIAAGEINYYRIRARLSDTNTYSAFSGEASAWAVSIAPPSELQYTLGANGTMTLTWKDNSNNESGFIVERKLDDEVSWSRIAACNADQTSYIGTMPAGEAIYYYRVKSFDNTGTNASSYSEELMVSGGLPNPPANLKTDAISPTKIRVRWTDNSNNEDGFIIERVAGSNITYWEMGRTTANVTEFIDTPYISGRYTYRVKAFNKKGNSAATMYESIDTIAKVTFTDLSKVPWAKDDIETMASRGLLNISADKKFRPLDKITKGELMSMLVKGFNLKAAVAGSFADVGPRHKYYKEIMTANSLGIALVDGSRKFKPDSYVTREDMAVFLFRTMNIRGKPLKFYDPAILDEYSDKDNIATYARYSLASLRGENLMYGRSAPGDIYVMAPKDRANRVEAALLIYRMIDK